MTKRDFFRIIIKLFGLYQIIIVFFQTTTTYISLAYPQFGFSDGIWGLFALGISVFFLVVLLNKTDYIIRLLKLDSGFDDDRIEVGNLNSQSILQIGIILIAGPLILYNIPQFLTRVYVAFRSEFDEGNVIGLISGSEITLHWFISGSSIIIGYLLLTNSKKMAVWLNQQSKIE